MFSRMLGLVACAALTVSTANAAVITQAAQIFGSGQPDYTYATFEFEGFDASLGTLTGASVSSTISVSETLNYQFASSSSPTVPVTIRYDISAFNQPYVYATQTTTGSATYPSGGEIVRVSASNTLTTTISDANLIILASGSGFGGRISSTVTNPAFPSSLTATVNASATATYEYTPFGAASDVPEPGTLALLGLAGVIPVVRRKLKRS